MKLASVINKQEEQGEELSSDKSELSDSVVSDEDTIRYNAAGLFHSMSDIQLSDIEEGDIVDEVVTLSEEQNSLLALLVTGKQ